MYIILALSVFTPRCKCEIKLV